MKLLVILSILSSSSLAFAGAKMDLDDVTIKGELHNDDRLKLLARQKNELKNYVKYRTNYRSEIVEDLPKPKPKVKY
jgi:precorrin-6B methylase 1